MDNSKDALPSDAEKASLKPRESDDLEDAKKQRSAPPADDDEKAEQDPSEQPS